MQRTTKDRVRELLERSPGAFISGAHIAEELGVSRNSVWKAVKALRNDGFEIESVTKRGHRLIASPSTFDAASIARLIDDPQIIIDFHDCVSSTNTVAKQLAEEGAPQGTLVVANSQSAGRGRQGRSFFSPQDTGVYFTLVLRPRFAVEDVALITSFAACCLADAIDENTSKHAQIKWVNDVYLRGRKVCGILTEAAVDFESSGLHYAILGIGINLRAPEGGFPPEIAGVAGALFHDEVPPGARARLAAGILNRFFAYYSALPRRDYMEAYRQRSLLTGLEVTYTQGSQSGEGLVLGVDEEARLLLRLPDGQERAFSAGEVQIKKDFLARLRQEGEREPT